MEWTRRDPTSSHLLDPQDPKIEPNYAVHAPAQENGTNYPCGSAGMWHSECIHSLRLQILSVQSVPETWIIDWWRLDCFHKRDPCSFVLNTREMDMSRTWIITIKLDLRDTSLNKLADAACAVRQWVCSKESFNFVDVLCGRQTITTVHDCSIH